MMMVNTCSCNITVGNSSPFLPKKFVPTIVTRPDVVSKVAPVMTIAPFCAKMLAAQNTMQSKATEMAPKVRFMQFPLQVRTPENRQNRLNMD
jgi:hypothetical protein